MEGLVPLKYIDKKKYVPSQILTTVKAEKIGHPKKLLEFEQFGSTILYVHKRSRQNGSQCRR